MFFNPTFDSKWHQIALSNSKSDLYGARLGAVGGTTRRNLFSSPKNGDKTSAPNLNRWLGEGWGQFRR